MVSNEGVKLLYEGQSVIFLGLLGAIIVFTGFVKTPVITFQMIAGLGTMIWSAVWGHILDKKMEKLR